jgi:hypothetical protein
MGQGGGQLPACKQINMVTLEHKKIVSWVVGDILKGPL